MPTIAAAPWEKITAVSLVFTLHPLVDGCQEPREPVVIK
jgi:hypothetical protein